MVEKNYDFISQASSSIDEKIRNSLSSTHASFQQTFLSKSMPDLNEIHIPEERTYDENDFFTLPPIDSSSTGVLDAQVEDQQKTVLARRKSHGDISIYDEDHRGNEYEHGHLLQEEIDKLMLKKRGILTGIEIPTVPPPRSRAPVYEEIDFSEHRTANLKDLTKIAKKSPKRLSIAEEYIKIQAEQKMEKDIKYAQAIYNATEEQKIQTLQDSWNGFDSFRFAPANSSLTPRSRGFGGDGAAAPSEHTFVNDGKTMNPPPDQDIDLENTINEIERFRFVPAPIAFTASFEPEESIPMYSNREEKKKKQPQQASQSEEKQQSTSSQYSIKLYEKKEKPSVNPKQSKGKLSTKKGSYSDIAADKKSNEHSKKTPASNKRGKRKVKSANEVRKDNNALKNKPETAATNKPGTAATNDVNNKAATRKEVKSALDSTGPFCQCSDEETGNEEHPVDAKHSLDYPIVKPVWYTNEMIPGFWSAQGFIPTQPRFPQGHQQQIFAVQQLPDRSPVNGNLYLPNEEQAAKAYNIPNYAEESGGRYNDCPLAQRYFNKVSSVRDYTSPFVETKPPMMPSAPVGMANPSLAMMHTPVFGGTYTTTGQEFLPPMQGFQQQSQVFTAHSRSNNQSPQNTSSGYSTDEPESFAKPTMNGNHNKSKQRISKSFTGSGNEEIDDKILKQNKVLRQKQYAESIRQSQENMRQNQADNEKSKQWNGPTKQEIEKQFVESRRAAALNYAKNLQQNPPSHSPANVPIASNAKPLPKNPAEIDRENLLSAIEQMKERHEQDKVDVQKLTDGRPKKSQKQN